MRETMWRTSSRMHHPDGMPWQSAIPDVRVWLCKPPANRTRSAKPSAIAPSAIAIAGSSRSAHSRSDRTEVKLSGKRRKTLRHRPIDVATERHHEVGDTVEPFPSPLIELRRLAIARDQRIDLLLLAREAQREPFLALSTKFR